MSYRSDVKIVMAKEDYEKLKAKYYETDREDLFYEKHNKSAYECDFIYEERKNGEIVLFGWEWIKWDGKDCRFIEDYIYELGDDDKGNRPCKMIIMGEDGATMEYIADIIDEEDLYNDYDIIHANYNISIDYEI